MLRLTDDIRNWLLERIPDTPVSPKGGRPPLDKARVLGGISGFWTTVPSGRTGRASSAPRVRSTAISSAGSATGSSSACCATRAGWLRSATARRRLIEAGVSPEDCVVIRDSVDFGALQRARETARRSRLDLHPDDHVWLALPPAEPNTGGYLAAWSAMLLDKLVAGTRLVISSQGRDAGRLRRLVEVCRHTHVVRFAAADAALPELLALCDAVVFLPESDAPATNLAWAMASGRPIVASAVPAVSEFLAHGQNAWLVRPGDPKDTTRRLLQALERPADSHRQAELARSQAFKVFGRQRMVEQYQRLYENLAAGRALDAGLVDAAAVG
jgi:glycosyltransferase involved in cell wall biosynthesis